MSIFAADAGLFRSSGQSLLHGFRVLSWIMVLYMGRCGLVRSSIVYFQVVGISSLGGWVGVVYDCCRVEDSLVQSFTLV